MITNIPKHWKIKKLGEICKVNQGLQIAIEERFTEPIENGYFYITNEFLKANSKTKYYIKNPSKSVLCSKEDILMTRTGNTGIVVSDVEGVFHNNFFKIDYDKKLLHKDYFVYYLKNDRMQYDILVKAGNSTIPDLNHSDFYTLQIAIPPLEEQEKIAEILLSCDKAIRLTTQIITQLKQRNQGLAQQLLTGEKRVKGFENSVWKEVRLGEIGSTYNGLTSKSKEDFGEGKPYIPYLNIFSNHIVDSAAFELVKIGVDDKQNKVIYGDILFTISSETPDEVGMSSVMLSNIDELYLNSFCFGFRLYSFDNLLPQYACYLFRNKDFREEIIRLAQGSTRFNLSKSEFLKTRVFLPTLTEQNAIAQILDTAHQELKLHEQKLQLLQAQKKTLMQKLLTGEVLTIKK